MSTGGKLMLAMLVFAILAVILCIKVSLGLGITVGVLGIVGAAFWAALAGAGPKFDHNAVQATGTAATATVRDVRDTGVTLNNIYFVIELALSVEVDGKEPWDAVVKTTVSRVKIPAVGSQVAVKFDPANPANVVLAEG